MGARDTGAILTMADLTNLIDGPWILHEPESPERQLRKRMEQEGLSPSEDLVFDGKIHRFRSVKPGLGKRGDKTGWYVAFGDGVPAGRFGCWRSGIDETWRADVGRQLTHAEEMARAVRLEEARRMRDEEQARHREVAENSVATIWGNSAPASAEHPYLRRKRVQPHGTRVTGDGRLIVPMHDSEGNLCSVQYIDDEGGKLYHSHGEARGKTYVIGPESTDTLYIAEGFATAATVAEVTGKQSMVAFSASNLVHAAEQARAQWPERKIVIVADNDKRGTGLYYADQASARTGASVVMPPEYGDANDYHAAGKDLLGLLEPPKSTWLVPASEMLREAPPIKWLVRDWVQEEALCMVYGPSGSGKTFLVLDWALSIASGKGDWMGRRSKTGRVVYLAGEGHHGLRVRLAAWAQRYGIRELDCFVSSSGCDLNKPEGWQHTAQAIRDIGEPPCLIIVDTLHRFLDGDENSSEDTRGMVRACEALTKTFGATVLLVHHTGHGQTRARGSSAWKGSLDIEVSVVQTDGVLTIERTKVKDADPIPAIGASLEVITIDGRVDEDGQPVTSVVLAESQPREQQTRPSPELAVALRVLERTWWDSGCELDEGAPYVSASALRELLLRDGCSTAAARRAVDPAGGKTITLLLNSGAIRPSQHGWCIVDDAMATRLMLSKT